MPQLPQYLGIFWKPKKAGARKGSFEVENPMHQPH